MSNIPGRRWFCFSLRTVFVALTLAALLPWLAASLYWLHERSVMLDSGWVPLEGEAPAPWPLWLFGAKGFARINAKVPPDKVAGIREAARDGRIHFQRVFPEAEVIVTSNAH
jgi:hypothetical protein